MDESPSNRCSWLMTSQTYNCPGLAREQGLCLKHINKSSPSPCIHCGKGTKTLSSICKECGYNKERLRNVYSIKKNKKLFSSVMMELKIVSYDKLLNN